MKPDIIHDDESIVIVSKPAGMLTIPDRFDKDFPNVRAFLLDMFGEIFTVHRLDRDTSGVLIFAKNAEVEGVRELGTRNEGKGTRGKERGKGTSD